MGILRRLAATANDFAEMAKTKLNMPLLAIAGEKASAGTLMPQAKLVGTNVTVVTIRDSGHWVMEEKEKETIDALMNSCELEGSASPR